MEGLAKWFVVPLCLCVIWMLVVFVRDEDRMQRLSPRQRLALRVGVGLCIATVLAVIWYSRNRA